MTDSPRMDLPPDAPYRVWLNLLSGVGPRIQSDLLDAFGSAEAVYRASESKLKQINGVGGKLAGTIRQARELNEAEAEIESCRNRGVQLMFQGEVGYPRLLDEIPTAPRVFYVQGHLTDRDDIAVAMVGSRHCTEYGLRTAHKLAFDLAMAGVTVVSGLARGIDAAAHRGALEAQGRTIAVAATGLGTVYPPEHADLSKHIAQRGAVVSESPLDRQPTPGLFPQRNRIISGLSLGVIVVEAHRKSGALHTTRHAAEQGRLVFAVPGRIDVPECGACLDLLRDGATLIRNADDVLEALAPIAEPVPPADAKRTREPAAETPRVELTDDEQSVYACISNEEKHLDQLLRECALDSPKVLASLTLLEMKRVIKRLPGGFFIRN